MARIVRREGIRPAVLDLRERTRQEWSRFPDLVRFLQDWFPAEADTISRCRRYVTPRRSLDRDERYTILPKACSRMPYCAVCVRFGNHRRTLHRLDEFAKVTPAGRPPRFQRIVLTAALTEEGEGWGRVVSEDLERFTTIVERSLRELYGPGIGGVMSYHDFGERAFKKRHPHMDLTLNGYLITEDAWKRLPAFNLEHGGRKRVDAVTRKYARSIQLDAQASNAKWDHMKEGRRVYYPILRYQERELVDMRKIVYRPALGRVGWRSYKNDRPSVTWFKIDEFLIGLDEYQRRLGTWRKDAARKQSLHRRFGHMAKGKTRAAQRLVGGEIPPHRMDCACGTCESWVNAFDEFDSGGNPVAPPVEVSLDD